MNDAHHVRSVLQQIRAMPEPELVQLMEREDAGHRSVLFLCCVEVLRWWNAAKLEVINLKKRIEWLQMQNERLQGRYIGEDDPQTVQMLQTQVKELTELLEIKDMEITDLKKWMQEAV